MSPTAKKNYWDGGHYQASQTHTIRGDTVNTPVMSGILVGACHRVLRPSVSNVIC